MNLDKGGGSSKGPRSKGGAHAGGCMFGLLLIPFYLVRTLVRR